MASKLSPEDKLALLGRLSNIVGEPAWSVGKAHAASDELGPFEGISCMDAELDELVFSPGHCAGDERQSLEALALILNLLFEPNAEWSDKDVAAARRLAPGWEDLDGQ